MFDFLDEILPVVAILFLIVCYPILLPIILAIFLFYYIVHVIKKLNN